MVASAGQIQTFRDREMTMLYRYLAGISGTSTITNVTIGGVQVRIRAGASDDMAKLHKKSIAGAITTIIAAGHALPTLDFYLTGSDVPNIAMKTYDPAGNPAPTILLGPKMWSKNPMLPGSDALLVGGLGTGDRGVANQAYDSSQSWFGNPGQRAQGECIVIHELGHVLHEINSPGVFWEEQSSLEAREKSPNGQGWQNGAPDVSGYAAKNQLEFVAEVFSGVMIGKNYGDNVMALYNALGGP